MAQTHNEYLLKDDFLGYLAEWNKSVGFTAAQRQQMMLSRETVEGLTITGLQHTRSCVCLSLGNQVS